MQRHVADRLGLPDPADHHLRPEHARAGDPARLLCCRDRCACSPRTASSTASGGKPIGGRRRSSPTSTGCPSNRSRRFPNGSSTPPTTTTTWSTSATSSSTPGSPCPTWPAWSGPAVESPGRHRRLSRVHGRADGPGRASPTAPSIWPAATSTPWRGRGRASCTPTRRGAAARRYRLVRRLRCTRRGATGGVPYAADGRSLLGGDLRPDAALPLQRRAAVARARGAQRGRPSTPGCEAASSGS